MSELKLSPLDQIITKCKRCPRLIHHCQETAKKKRRSYSDWKYWGKPVPNFGDLNAELLILGLAPACHGANRTGRMFTGDRSGDWLYRALFKAGFANQPTSIHISDGLLLKNCLVTAVAHCAPPANKLSQQEILNCQTFFDSTLDQSPIKVIIALGSVAWTAAFKTAKTRNWTTGPIPKFAHAAEIKFNAYLKSTFNMLKLHVILNKRFGDEVSKDEI